jgi:hypothetical protein
MRTLFSLFVLALTWFTVAEVVAADHVRLATFTLTDRTDRDVVELPPCGSSHNTTVTAIQLKVNKFPAEINRIKVTFHNGQTLDLKPNVHVKAGGHSPWLDLPGNARCIQKIVIVGDTDTVRKAPKKKAEIIILGRPAAAAVQARATGGTKLGVVRLAETTDRDVIQLPRCKNSPNPKISSLRFTVAEHAAEINRLTIEFQNGERTELQVKDHFAVGSSSRWMDMPGDKRCVAKIIVIGDADTVRKAPKKQSKVTFYGK